MTNLLPARYAPSFTDLAHQGLYSCIRERGIELLSATQSVGARNASEVEADLLHIGTGSSLLTMERTAYDGAGAAVEYGLHYYDAQRYSFKFTLSSE
jgi:DNA-binding GntR family transcriptional regulator